MVAVVGLGINGIWNSQTYSMVNVTVHYIHVLHSYDIFLKNTYYMEILKHPKFKVELDYPKKVQSQSQYRSIRKIIPRQETGLCM